MLSGDKGVRGPWLRTGGDKGVRGPWLSPGRDCARSAACHGFLWVSVSANSALTRSAGGCREIAHPALSFAAAHATRPAGGCREIAHPALSFAAAHATRSAGGCRELKKN